MINLRLNSRHYAMLYPQNGDRIVTIDSVTSLYPMYIARLFHQRHPPKSIDYRLDTSVPLCLGALVSARYSRDNQWYRARIVAFLQKGSIFHCCGFQLLFSYTYATVHLSISHYPYLLGTTFATITNGNTDCCLAINF